MRLAVWDFASGPLLDLFFLRKWTCVRIFDLATRMTMPTIQHVIRLKLCSGASGTHEMSFEMHMFVLHLLVEHRFNKAQETSG